MKKLNNNNLYQLLHLIKFEGSLKRLVRNNITYIEIAKNMESLIEDGKLEYQSGKIALTENGEKSLEQLSKIYKNRNKEEWIEKENKSRINKIDIDFVFLPNQNELHF